MPRKTTNRPRFEDGHVGFRFPEPSDGQAIWALAERAGLDLNSPYAYVMWADHHAATSIVAEVDERLVGFIIGFRIPAEPRTVFVWQIAVDEGQRGNAIGGRMLDQLVERTASLVVEATVTPDNTASAALFRSLAARHGTEVDTTLAYSEALFPDGHEAEIRFRIPVHTNETTRD